MPDSFFAQCDRGRQRETNQDSAIATRLPDGLILVAVADGVGGARGGAVASAATIRALHTSIANAPGEAPCPRLEVGLAAANREVRRISEEDPHLHGMASTLVAAVVRGREAWVANVGDSRAYRCAGNLLEPLTEDDSWVAEQVRAGLLTEDEAERSPYRNAITRGIGVVDELDERRPRQISLAAGDVLLLCSDGLYRPLDAAAIAAVLQEAGPADAAPRLIALANEAGGPDNIGVAIFRAG